QVVDVIEDFARRPWPVAVGFLLAIAVAVRLVLVLALAVPVLAVPVAAVLPVGSVFGARLVLRAVATLRLRLRLLGRAGSGARLLRLLLCREPRAVQRRERQADQGQHHEEQQSRNRMANGAVGIGHEGESVLE